MIEENHLYRRSNLHIYESSFVQKSLRPKLFVYFGHMPSVHEYDSGLSGVKKLTLCRRCCLVVVDGGETEILEGSMFLMFSQFSVHLGFCPI